MARTSGPGMAEKQDVAIEVLDLESPQTIMRVFERFRELHVTRRELGGQRIGIGNGKIRVPSGARFALVVRQWIHPDGLEHDHRAASANDSEKGIVRRPLEGDFKAKLVAIERKRRLHICDDKKG